MTVIRRLDAVLEDTKQQVLDMKKMLDGAGVTNQWAHSAILPVRHSVMHPLSACAI